MCFHSLRLLENSKRYCGILLYFGMCFIFVSKNAYGIKYISISLVLIHKHNFGLFTKQKILWSNNGWSITVHANKKSHIAKLEDLVMALFKNGLKISPKKCQLFKKELQYMGNIIFIKDRTACIKPLQSMLQAIQNLQLTMTVNGCRNFAGMVNFLKFYFVLNYRND